MKKILIFSLFYYPNPVSGAEVAVKEITDRIKPEDYSFDMVTLRGTKNISDHEKIGNVNVYRILPGTSSKEGGAPTLFDFSLSPFKYYKYYYQIYAGLFAVYLHKKNKYDAVWVLMPHSSGIPASIFNLFNPTVPVILTLQEGDPIEKIEKSVKPLWFLFKRIFPRAAAVQAISTYLGSWARHRGFVGKLEIIYNGANENDFKDEVNITKKQELEKIINKKEGEVILVTTSRLVEKNAIDDCITALSYLPENIRFVIAGNGDDYEKLVDQAKRLGVTDRVIFLGQVDRETTAILRKLGDIFVRPSRSEGLGNSFAGAMAARIPIIATQEGGIAEFLFDKDKNKDRPTTGFAVNKNSPKEISEQVEFILNNKEFVEEVVNNAYREVVEKYRWPNIAQDMKEKIFDYVLKEVKDK